MTGATPDDELANLVAGGGDIDEDDDGFAAMFVPALVFRVGGWWFSLGPEAVVEVGVLDQLNAVPSLPSHVLGLVLLRNQLVPVIDLAAMLGDVPEGERAQTAPRIVIVGNQEEAVGVRADEAHGIVEISLEPSRTTTEHDFIIGAARWGEHHLQRLDSALLLAAGLEL